VAKICFHIPLLCEGNSRGRYRRIRIHRFNGLREAAQAIYNGDQEIIQSTAFELVRLHGELSTADLFLLG
jgi:hypothetical protein